MLRILVIRHGETFSNAENRFSGHQDVDLNEKGIWQAEQLANRLKDEQIDFAYSSDLKRATCTAKIGLKYHNIEVKTEPLFREMSFGKWEGLNVNELDFDEDERLMEWWKYPDLSMPGGESTSELKERVLTGLNRIIKEHNEKDKEKTVVIVCHGGVARIILAIALDIPTGKVWHIRQFSTALNVIKFFTKNGYYVETVNDINHLRVSKKKEKVIEKQED